MIIATAVQALWRSSLPLNAMNGDPAKLLGYLTREYRCHRACGMEREWMEQMRGSLRAAEDVFANCVSLLDILGPALAGESNDIAFSRAMGMKLKWDAMFYIAAVKEMFADIERRYIHCLHSLSLGVMTPGLEIVAA